jgi:hypothetical protein
MKYVAITALAFSLTALTGCANDDANGTNEGNPAGQSINDGDDNTVGPGDNMNEDGTDVYNDSTDMDNTNMNNQ